MKSSRSLCILSALCGKLAPMLAKVYSCAVIGLEGAVVEVEVDTTNGLPTFVVVGLPDAAVQESRERVQAAIRNAGFYFPQKRLTVNLAPAALRKEGPAYDLPIALGVLTAMGQIPAEAFDGVLVVGELALAEGYRTVFVPAADAREAALVPDVDVIPVANLAQLVKHLSGAEPIAPATVTPGLGGEDIFVPNDFREVKGQEHVKRALEVAAAGGHNVIMTGPPGAGKTLLARALPSILPRLTIDEALDVTRVYSVADQLPAGTPLIQHRPFRAPHHTISHAGLVGGGNYPRPGEISLAHRGVLFLDELPEFAQKTLEVMRQPLEDKIVTIARAKGSLTFPANFMLVASMNPCPHGLHHPLPRAQNHHRSVCIGLSGDRSLLPHVARSLGRSAPLCQHRAGCTSRPHRNRSLPGRHGPPSDEPGLSRNADFPG